MHRGRGMGKDMTTSSRLPEFSRSMSSDNWREAKKREPDTDAGGSWRNRPGGIFFLRCFFSQLEFALYQNVVITC